MPKLLENLWRLLNRYLTGREDAARSQHPYFGHVTYFGARNEVDGYWEAEMKISGLPKPVGIVIPADRTGPGDADVRACRTLLGDLDALFARCTPAFQREYAAWTSRPFPEEWREGFELDGLSLPRAGDLSREWDVCYFVNAANHYFTARFEGGKLQEVVVDG